MKADRAAIIANIEARIRNLEALRPALDEEIRQAQSNYELARQTTSEPLALVNLRLAENQRSEIDTRLAVARRKLIWLQNQEKG